MKLINDFKKFISRGNLIDLAVGIMIGAAFNSIVKSFVDDILTPFISVFLGKANMAAWKIEFSLPIGDGIGSSNIVAISYGKFIQACIDFFILAIIVFIIAKIFNNLIEKANDPKNKDVPTPKDIELLNGINESLSAINQKLK